MRQIVLDTETTGLDPKQGHRVIEIGAVELINRRVTGKTFHCYINPEREVEADALSIHNISNEFLKDKPLFASVSAEFFEFIRSDELIIHNAPFDLGFLDAEIKRIDPKFKAIKSQCAIIDTLVLARKFHPGLKNNLDALCKRYEINNTHREWHGALLDAEILARVYLAMTGGQGSLFGEGFDVEKPKTAQTVFNANQKKREVLPVLMANDEELTAHDAFLEKMKKHFWEC